MENATPRQTGPFDESSVREMYEPMCMHPTIRDSGSHVSLSFIYVLFFRVITVTYTVDDVCEVELDITLRIGRSLILVSERYYTRSKIEQEWNKFTRQCAWYAVYCLILTQSHS